MKKKIGKVLYWTPRIISILFILFLAMFSLDVFESCDNILGCALGLFIHNIPVFILIFFIWLSWKKEIIGAEVFLTAGILYILFVLLAMVQNGFELFYVAWIVQISGISFLVAYLFYRNWKIRKK